MLKTALTLQLPYLSGQVSLNIAMYPIGDKRLLPSNMRDTTGEAYD